MQPLIIIKNQGQAIVETNYFDSAHAQAGALYLSWNARAARLLVPDNQKQILRELRDAREVLISRGPWADQGNRDGRAFTGAWIETSRPDPPASLRPWSRLHGRVD